MGPDDRAERAAALRSDALALLDATGLLGLLTRRFGEATLIGSASYHLMAWRDIDMIVPIERHRWLDWMALGPAIAEGIAGAGLMLHIASWGNAYVDPEPDSWPSFFWGFKVRDGGDAEWRLDLWGWEPAEYHKRCEETAALREKLAGADRDLILRLKAEAQVRDLYGKGVSGWDIYHFAIDRAGTTLAELESWKRARSKGP